MSDIEPIRVEVAFALPDKQKIVELLVAPGTTALIAVEKSRISDFFADLDLAAAKMGIFGQALGTKGLKQPSEHILQEGDRVEIYRPLIADPKEVRRRRAEKNKKEA
ncbi:RnfH family protein [Teredinibacter purpureus]|uniref:RnfH family protein n=1 Tax=Teredinibacter purpureus TaxID=2731756 RepID=UPI0005F7759F|nr:RnfH family protein [Teredinibacter purpureus]